ncbi:DUF3667 domain-containing protein [Rugamonas aquatica]|uniref:DUF3667 domain-containing protein n=1 Tax=Rugamonas aquatica TaxID=2743357 RepID=A0A6A7NBE5_9BURK|nr:DUF3667 domain-containing protein [Rugamonas aquatica]MQA42112.1 DUF3667 domain-containing protein [Rugamonas aquatica]
MTSPPLHAVPAPAAHHATPEFCPGCQARLGVNFCPQCGQEAVLHPPSMGEFVAEFIGHYVAIEGKLWRTMGQLLLRPGALTKAYMAGKRVNYMQPLRLFLTLSVILFALLQFSGFSVGESAKDGTAAKRPAVRADIGKTELRVADAANIKRYEIMLGYYNFGVDVTPDGSHVNFGLTLPSTDNPSFALTVLRTVFPTFQQSLDRYYALPPGQKAERLTHGFFARMPYVIFFMVPVFALFLKLLYLPSGRRYGEYLLFALHVNAFAFFIMALVHVTPWVWGTRLLLALLFLYIARAMHNVYGGAPLATVARWLVLVVAYLMTLAVIITQVMLFISLTSA